MTMLAHTRVVRSAQERTATTGRFSVPWSAVMTFAIAITCADWFWVMSLRLAAGHIQRTQAPFSDWLRESMLVLPVFTLAVLGAFTLALHRFGPTISKPRAVVATSLMIVSTTTLTAIIGLVASSAFDYYLQSNELLMNDGMRAMCTSAGCGNLRHDTFWLQVHSVGWGSLLFLATNLVVVGWIVALRAGRLTLRQPSAVGTADGSAAAGSRVSRLDDVRVFMAAALVGSAAIHAAVVPARLSNQAAAGVFFVLVVAAQLGVAIQIGSRLGRGLLLATAAVSGLPLLAWGVTRGLGLAWFGPQPGIAEPIGLTDLAAGALQVGTLIGAVALLARKDSLGHRSSVSGHAKSLVLVAVVALVVAGLAGTELPMFSYFHNVTLMVRHN
jgi:hypothetical protein